MKVEQEVLRCWLAKPIVQIMIIDSIILCNICCEVIYYTVVHCNTVVNVNFSTTNQLMETRLSVLE